MLLCRNQDRNLDQSVTLHGGALSAPNRNSSVVRKQVKRMVVQTNPPPELTLKKPHNIKQKRRNRRELEKYDVLGTWPSVDGHMPWMHSWSDVSVEARGLGTREFACSPSLCLNQRCRPGGYLWVDRSSAKEELVVSASAVLPAACSSVALLAVRSSVIRSGFVSWSGPDIALIVCGTRGSLSCFSIQVEVNHPNVDLALSSVPGGRGFWNRWSDIDPNDEFDDTLVPFYGHPGRQLLPPNAPMYNKYVDKNRHVGLGGSEGPIPIRVRNIRVSKPLVIKGLHVGGVSRLAHRTFVQNIGGRKTNTINSFVRVKGGHHEGKNYFASGCRLDPPLLGYCRIVYIDTKKLHWC